METIEVNYELGIYTEVYVGQGPFLEEISRYHEQKIEHWHYGQFFSALNFQEFTLEPLI